MAVPQHIFIDTNIFDACSYNFDSTPLQIIVEVATPLTLLLPEITEREIRRHIKERSKKAFSALQTAERQVPFLKKWASWPFKSEHDLHYRLNGFVTNELHAFFARFQVVRLDASYIAMGEVLDWYDNVTAPFESGKKHEFPDAFALSSLLTFTKKEELPVAIISQDLGFQNASALYDGLFFYQTVAAYVESLNSSDEHVQQIREILQSHSEVIAKRVLEEFYTLDIYLADDESAEFEDEEVYDVEISEMNITGTGEQEASVSFQAEVSFSITAVLSDSDWNGPFSRSKRLDAYAEVIGIAKLTINDDWTDFKSLDYFKLDDNPICIEVII